MQKYFFINKELIFFVLVYTKPKTKFNAKIKRYYYEDFTH